MKNLTFKAAMLNDSRTTVNRQSTDGQSQRHCKKTPLSKRWKVLMTLVFLFTMGIGQMWGAYYTPTADEVIILNDVYSSTATDAGYSTHSAIAWAGTGSTKNDRKCGDPNNGGAATSANVVCYSAKGNGTGKNITISITGCSKIIIYHENKSDRYIELRSETKSGTLIGQGAVSTYYTEVNLTASTSYNIFLHGTKGSDDQDLYIYAIKLIKDNRGADPVPVTGIAITPSAATIKVGKTVTLVPTITPSNATDKAVTWAVTSGSSYASVTDAGVVTGLEEGTAVITATAHDGSGVKQTVTVNVEECPTSGTLFSMTVTDPDGTVYTDVTKDAPQLIGATYTGGKAYAASTSTSKRSPKITGTEFDFNVSSGGSVAVKVELECPLAEGDIITFTSTHDKNFYIRKVVGTDLHTTASLKLEIPSGSDLIGEEVFYIMRTNSACSFSQITITRPAPAATYDATFENGGHGTAPAAATGVSSVTLTELTESGWINTGWKADKATKVGTTDKAAGATLNIGDKVTLLDHTTFTAQWEAEKQTPEVTFNDGAYVVGASALDLSSLFTSQNESAISFALKVASEDATISGNNFTATKEGSYVVVATQTADAAYKAVSKEATIVVTYPATGAATIIYNVAVGTSQATLATASKEDNSASISNLVGFTAVNIATRSGNGKTGSSPKLETPATKVQGKYIYVTFDVADGKEFVLDSVVTKMVAVTSSKTIEIVISDTEGTKDSLNYEQGTNNDPGTAHQFNFTSSAKAYQGTVTVKIYAYGATDDYRIGKPLKVCGTVKAATPKFAVSFAKGGADGSETMNPVNYEVGAQVTAPDCDFTYTDHIFREWAVTGVTGVTSVAAGGKFYMPSNAVTLTAQWLANNYEAKIGTTFYATLAEALARAADGEIELLKNVDVTEQVEIAAGVTATIDLAGYKIEYTGTETLPSGVILVHNGASLTINDSSDPDAGKVVSGEKAYAAVALTKLGDDASQAANLTINGGTFTGLYYAITGNGARHNTNITINAGTFTATAENDNLAIFHPQNGTLTINGGTFTGYASAIEMRAGTLVINDGIFQATATEFSCNPSGSGSTTVGAAIAIAQHTTKKDISVTINGGTFNGVKAFNEANPQGNPDPAITMSVTGGNFTGRVSTADVNNFVSGGSFSTPVAESQCATGYVPETKPNGKYGVIVPAQSIDFMAIIDAKGTGDEGKAELDNQLSTKHYDIDGTLNNDRLDGGSGADKGFKVKVNGLTISFSVEAGKMVEITTGHISGANIKVDAEAAVTLATSQTYTYYSDDAQAFLITMTTGSYNIFKSINIRDPYVVTFDVNGGDAQIAPKDATPSVTLPSASKGTDSFVGWFDGETKIGEAGESYTPTANITLVAHWEAVSTDARLSAIEFSAVGTLSPAFDPDVVNYTYIMPYGTADVPTITGATAANAKAQEPVIDAQAAAWGETAHVHGVAQSGATKDYYVRMLRAPKDGTCIVKADLAPGSSAASITATSGAYKDADNIAININKDLKLGGTGAYVKVAVKDTYFQDGDVVEITLASDKNASAWLQIFADEGTTLVAEMTSGVSKASPNYLTISGVPANTSALYLYRTETAAGNMNPYPTSMAVTRPMNPMLTAITINGRDGEIDPLDDKHFNVTIPYEADLANLTIVDEVVWNAPAATDARIVVSNSGNWKIGDNTYRLTDKDGDYTDYIITLTRDVKKYTVSFNAQGGSTVQSELVVAGEKLAAAPADPTREDYLFLGWAETAEGEVVDVTDFVINADKEFYAQWKYENPIVILDENGDIDHDNFFTGMGKGTVNFGGANHNCISFSSTASTIVGATGSNKFIVYNAKTTKTRIKFVLYNTQSSAKNIVLQKVAEGETAPTNVVIKVPSQQQFTTEYYAYNSDENRSMYVYTENTGIKVLQVKVIESGTPIHQAGQAGYVLNLNKGRVFAPSNEDVEFEGLSMKVSSNYKVLNSEVLQTENNLSFQVNELVTMTLVSTGAKYKVSKNPAGSGKEYAAGTNKHTLTQGTWYIVSSTGSNMKFTNISFEEPVADHTRDNLNPSFLGTLCWTNDAILGGATLYEFAGKDEHNYLVFDEVEENRLEAGKPYIFMPENGNTEIKVYNIDESDPMTESQLQPVNNMYGTLDGKTLVPGVDDNMYYFSSNHIWAVKDFTVNIPILPNRCYIDYPAVLAADPAPAAAPGRRRVTMGVNGQNVATGMGEIEASETPMKVMINGQIFIIRGEKMFDATGRLVK